MNSNTTKPALNEPFILKWQEGNGYRRTWFIRGIRPDGSFYGDGTIRTETIARGFTILGRLSSADYQALLSLVSAITNMTKDVTHELTKDCDGVIGVGTPSQGRVVFRYSSAEHKDTEVGQLFLEIVDIVAKYLCEYQNPI
jgi:hypothetical protein